VFGHYIQHEKAVEADLKGTIIDIETVGESGEAPYCQDKEDYLARYRDIRITAVGILAGGRLQIFAAKGIEYLADFQRNANTAWPN